MLALEGRKSRSAWERKIALWYNKAINDDDDNDNNNSSVFQLFRVIQSDFLPAFFRHEMVCVMDSKS